MNKNRQSAFEDQPIDRRSMKKMLRFVFLFFSIFLFHNIIIAQNKSRWQMSLNEGWRTIAGNDENPIQPSFQQTVNDSEWKLVNVPHNWDSYYGYRRFLHGNKHGDTWYRKRFTANSSKKGKRFFLCFEGVGSYATVYLNEHKVGEHAGGRTTFTIDVTDFIKTDGSENLLAVRAWHPPFIKNLPWVCGGCSDERGFSEGSQPMGIFRPVHLISTDDIRIEPFGVHAWATLEGNNAVLNINTTIKNYGIQKQNISICHYLIDTNGKAVANIQESSQINANTSKEVSSRNIKLQNINLWSQQNPYLYKIVSVIKRNNIETDWTKTDFGFRTINWKTPSHQFYLNGDPVFINGVAEYEHLLGKSHAFSDEEIIARLKWMEAAGFNAFRDAHQPHRLLYGQLFNQKGILWWTQFSAHVWYDTPEFKTNFKHLLREWVIERRNDPSVILWGLQNESKLPAAFADECTKLIRELDPTASSQRLVTTCNGGEGTDWDVPQNWTGTYGGDPDTYGSDLKNQVLVGEYGGWRTLDFHVESKSKQNGLFSEDQLTLLMEKKMRLAETVKDSVAGHFFWLLTSHDNPGRVQGGEGLRELDRIGPVNYKGMLTPWEEPTDLFYMFRSNYVDPNKDPMVYIASHTWPNRWTMPGIKDSIIVFSNCDEVELFNDIDGESLGKKKKDGFGTHFTWNNVKINYNLLYAIGYVNGKVMAKDTVRLYHLPDAPSTMRIKTTGSNILKPDKDLNYVYRVNCGGDNYIDQWGSKWRADRALPQNSNEILYGSSSWTKEFDNIPAFFASQRRTNSLIGGTADSYLFQTFRYGLNDLYYDFPLPNGEYQIELYFAEPWLGVGGWKDASGMRLFDVKVNDKLLIKDFDIWKEAGINSAVKKKFNINVTNGSLHLSFPNIKAGQAIISAIAIASMDKHIKPAGAFELVQNLKCKDCTYHTWLDEGKQLFHNEKIQINKLPSVLFGADWISIDRQIPGQIEFVVEDTADVYIHLDAKTDLSINGFEKLSDSMLSTENGSKKYNLYRKRFARGSKVVLDTKDIGLIGIVPAVDMQPAFDLKPVHSYRANTANLNQNVSKGIFEGAERAIINNNESAEIMWPITTGVADVYSITLKYYSPLKDDVKGSVQLIDKTNHKLLDAPILFKLSKPGKWNYITVSTEGMINAGSYQIKLTTSNAKDIVVSNIDIQ